VSAFPRRIKISAYSYTVRRDEAAIDRVSVTGQIDLMGNISHRDLVITVRPGPHQQERVTLLHEVLHGVFEAVGLDDRPEFGTGNLQEEIISALDVTLLQVLEDNPTLVAFLVGQS